MIGAVAFDKLRLAGKQPTSVTQHGSEVNLKRLAKEFATISEAGQRGSNAEADRLTRRMGGTPIPIPRRDKDA